MSQLQFRTPFARLIFISAVATAAAFSSRAQAPNADAPSSVPLDRYVVSASRTPQDPRTTPSSVSALNFEDLRREQIPSLAVALAQQPGVILYGNGAVGGQSSILVRGANNDQTLFFVDGVRMNDRSASYLNFLGGADLGGLDRIEVLRGPQSTLYGSSAMGGVILMETAHGAGAPSGTISATAGSFETFGASVAVKGAANAFSYSGSVARFETDNDRPRNAFDQWSYSTRLEYAAAPGVVLGGTFRGLTGDYDEPGSRLFASPGTVHSHSTLGTVYAQARINEEFSSRLTLGSHLRQYAWRSTGYYAPQSNERRVLDWQNTWSVAKELEVVAGANLEKSRYVVDTQRDDDRISAGYLSATAHPLKDLTLTAGLRYDHYRSAGSATTGRVGAAWLLNRTTKLHATYGTGFNAPSTADRYGMVAWGQLPNAGLKPEKSRGWDAGVEHYLAGGDVTVGATYFQNRFRNLFEWQYVSFVTYEGRIVNRARASTEGLELAASAKLSGGLQTRAAYTYLQARNDETGGRLVRRPRHSGDAELRKDVTSGWNVGVGAHVVADNASGVTPSFGGYSTVRVFTTFAVRPELLLKVRVENALDRKYEEIYGYPALPLGVFGSAEWKF